MSPAGVRLDQALVARGLAPNRTRAQALILAGRVFTGETRLDKPGARVPAETELVVRPGRDDVGRGAEKLRGALDSFSLDPRGLDAIDVGSSTGGFTQVLLERGARHVVAVDVGRGQLDWGLREREEVTVLEGTNARHLEPSALPYAPRLATMDVSFISIEKVLPALVGCLAPGAAIVSLIKPQFEAGREKVGRGGIVRDAAVHREVLTRIVAAARAYDWGARALADSPIRGADGNREFFVLLRPGEPSEELRAAIDRLVAPETR